MTVGQKALIRESFERIRNESDSLAAGFYLRLFEAHPDLRAMFQTGMRHQRGKFMDMLVMVVGSLDHLDHVVTAVWELGKRHAGYGVKDAHYDAVRDALIQALADMLDSDFTDSTRDAWEELYDLIASAMKQAGAEGAMAR